MFDLGIQIMVLKSSSGRRNGSGGNDAVSGATAVKEVGPKPMLLLVLKKGKRVMHIPLTDLVWFY